MRKVPIAMITVMSMSDDGGSTVEDERALNGVKKEISTLVMITKLPKFDVDRAEHDIMGWAQRQARALPVESCSHVIDYEYRDQWEGVQKTVKYMVYHHIPGLQ